MPQWYYSLNGQVHGPVSARAIAELVFKDQIGLEDKIMSDDSSNWRRISDTNAIMDILHKPLAHPVMADIDGSVARQILSDNYDPAKDQPILYNISAKRLLVALIITFGLFQIYWFFKQWNSLRSESKGRYSPFWVASGFLIFFVYVVFRKIESHKELNQALKPTFIANQITLGWYVLDFGAGAILFFSTAWLTICSVALVNLLVTLFIFVPVQKYINEGNAKLERPYSNLTTGYWFTLIGSICIIFILAALTYFTRFHLLGGIL